MSGWVNYTLLLLQSGFPLEILISHMTCKESVSASRDRFLEARNQAELPSAFQEFFFKQ